jgi:transcriptional regulator with XRE-family HTH domain
MGLSQTDLANKAGISRRQLSNIENNYGSPGMYIVFALLNELNIALFSGEKPRTLTLDELVSKREEEFSHDH